MRAGTRTWIYALLFVLLGALTACNDSSVASSQVTATYDADLHAALPPSVRESGVLRVGTDASYPPMSFFDEDGRTIVGVEPDLGEALGEVLGVDVKFVNRPFTGLLDDVAAGTLELAMSAVTDTAERAETVDFVNYFSAGTAILVQNGNPAGVTDIRDLCGRVVAVERGTVQVELLQRSQTKCSDPIRVRTFETNSDALLELRTGRATAVLNDLPPAVFVTTHKSTAAHFQLASTTQYEPGLYGIAVAKGRTDLREAVRGALEQLMAAGVYDEVLTDWGAQSGGVDEVSINSGR